MTQKKRKKKSSHPQFLEVGIELRGGSLGSRRAKGGRPLPFSAGVFTKSTHRKGGSSTNKGSDALIHIINPVDEIVKNSSKARLKQ